MDIINVLSEDATVPQGKSSDENQVAVINFNQFLPLRTARTNRTRLPLPSRECSVENGDLNNILTSVLPRKLCNAYAAYGARGGSILFASGDGSCIVPSRELHFLIHP